MKLLQLATSYQSVVTILASKLDLLRQSPGIELIVGSAMDAPGEARHPDVEFFPIDIPRQIRPVRDFIAIVKLWVFLKQKRIDLIHTHTAKAGVVGAIAGWLAGIPAIHTYHGLPFYEGQRKLTYSIYKYIELFLNRLRAMVFSQNQRDFRTLKNISQIRCPIEYEGNGVDISYIEKSVSAGQSHISEYFLNNKVDILCVSRLEPVKRIQTIIHAIKFITDAGIAVDCIIAGKGPQLKELEELIVSLGLSNIIKIIYTPHIHALIAKSDILVLSSEKEGIPRSIMEAMVLRKPVVATNVPGTDELVVDGITGFLVPLEDQHAFNARLHELIIDTKLRISYGVSGRARIESAFDERKIVSLWVDTYTKILKNTLK